MLSTFPQSALSPDPGRIVFSFVVDAHPTFIRQGYHLVKSINEHCGGSPIQVHVTPEVDDVGRAIFTTLGCRVTEIARFGDGRYCNKIAQLPQLHPAEFDMAILLDADTILVADLRRYLTCDALQAKIVDLPNPSLDALVEIARSAGMRALPPIVPTDGAGGETFAANCNGGVYAVPSSMIPIVAREWRLWAQWLLDDPAILGREGKEMHMDQVAMWLAICMNEIPWAPLPANLNYYVHLSGEHWYNLPDVPICVVHYHDSVDERGVIVPALPMAPSAHLAVEAANRQITGNLHNAILQSWLSHLDRQDS